MSGVATAFVAGSYITGKSNEKAAETAAGATPQYPEQIQPQIRRQLDRTNAGRGVDVYGGERVADFSPFQQQAFGLTPGVADTLQDAAGQSAAGFGMLTDPSRIGNNPFLEQAIAGLRETSLRDLQRNQLPTIRNNAVATGGLGGSRQGIAEGLAFSDLNRDLVNTEANLRAQQFNTDTSNMLSALINQGSILSGQTAAPDYLQRAGALQQGQTQAGLDARRQQFEEEQNLQYNRDQELLRILLGAPAAVTPIPNQTNPLVAGLGAATTVSQLFPQQQQQVQPTGQPGTPGFQPNSAAPQFLFG
jgi:hypothetical protein